MAWPASRRCAALSFVPSSSGTRWRSRSLSRTTSCRRLVTDRALARPGGGPAAAPSAGRRAAGEGDRHAVQLDQVATPCSSSSRPMAMTLRVLGDLLRRRPSRRRSARGPACGAASNGTVPGNASASTCMPAFSSGRLVAMLMPGVRLVLTRCLGVDVTVVSGWPSAATGRRRWRRAASAGASGLTAQFGLHAGRARAASRGTCGCAGSPCTARPESGPWRASAASSRSPGRSCPVTIVPTRASPRYRSPCAVARVHELVEVQRLVDLFEVLVVQVVVGLVAERLQFALEQHASTRRRPAARDCGEEVEQAPGLLGAELRAC